MEYFDIMHMYTVRIVISYKDEIFFCYAYMYTVMVINPHKDGTD